MTREQAREALMQMIFTMGIQNDFSEEAKAIFIKANNIGGKEFDYFEDMYTLVSGNLNKIDEYIDNAGINWKISRMAKVDVAILRVATCEILYREDIPAPVTVNEAVNLAKKFGTENSQKFVNGILSKIIKNTNE